MHTYWIIPCYKQHQIKLCPNYKPIGNQHLHIRIGWSHAEWQHRWHTERQQVNVHLLEDVGEIFSTIVVLLCNYYAREGVQLRQAKVSCVVINWIEFPRGVNCKACQRIISSVHKLWGQTKKVDVENSIWRNFQLEWCLIQFFGLSYPIYQL